MGLRPAKELKPQELRRDPGGRVVSLPSSYDGPAEELGNVRAACRIMGIHPSTFYRWKKKVERFGREIRRPRERRKPPMPNATPHLIE